MGRFAGPEEETQGETRGNHSTERLAPAVATSKGDGNFSDTPHGIEVLLTSREAPQVLKIHPKVLERMAKRGEVPALKVGKYWRYRATRGVQSAAIVLECLRWATKGERRKTGRGKWGEPACRQVVRGKREGPVAQVARAHP